MDTRARCGGFIPQNRCDLSSLWVMRFRGVVLICFYLLDAYYLTQEGLFREQYQWLVKNRLKTDERLFEVFPAHQTCRCAQFLCSMLSFSLFPYWALGFCLVGYGFVSNSVSIKC